MGTEKYQLERRECACGCKLTFKCLPTSNARFASVTHNPKYYPVKVDPQTLRAVKAFLQRIYGSALDDIH